MEPLETASTKSTENHINSENASSNNEQKDDTKVIALNDAPNDDDNELPRSGTTVINLSQQSEKDVVNYKHNIETRKKANSKDKNKNQKELSQIPYSLERLHNKTTMLDVLRVTKLRDLFAVSYIFRYIVCVIIGCISFLVLALLWKVIFRINSCRIERDDHQFRFMSFAYGFLKAYKFGLLIAAPLFHILLPTIHVTHQHRTRFIFAFLLIVFILFTCYGFYGGDWITYSYISSSILGTLSLIIFFYWGGYFAFWVIFPLFSAAFIAILIMSLMREYVWIFVNSNPVIFGLIYPMYLTILQQIALKCMLWFRLPYKIRKFFANCCPHCCCKPDKHGQTPVYYTYDNFNSFWTPSKYDLKYSQKRLKNSNKSMDLQVQNDNKSENNAAIHTPEIIENKQTNHENTDTAVIIKTPSTHVPSHTYKSTELELTVEDVWSNDILFVAGGTVIVLMESMRVAGMIALKDDIPALILNVISSIMLEALSRNNLYWEFIYRCILKKPNPPLTRFFSSIIGTRYQTEYIPYFVIFMMNLVKFGPTDSCKMEYLGSSVSMVFNKYLYMYIILFLSEILSDLFADWIKKVGRKKGWFGDEENGDPAREATYAKLKGWMMVCVFIAFFTISLIAFEIDYDAKTSGVV